MTTVLISAPYIVPIVDRFRPVFEHYGIDLIIPTVAERMEEEDLLPYAGLADGAVCGEPLAGWSMTFTPASPLVSVACRQPSPFVSRVFQYSA